MAKSSCVKCGSGNFELQEHAPKGSNFKLMFIQCASCGGVVGVMDYFNIGHYVKQIAEKLGIK